MALATKWGENYGIDENLIKGGCAISGIFDLTPLPYSFLQPKLQLGLGDVQALSPIYHLPKTGPELAVVVGGCLLYTSPSPRDGLLSRMPSSA